MSATAPAAPRLPRPKLLIDGKHEAAADGRTRETRNPATGEVLLEVAEAGPAEVGAAVSAARRAFDHGPWPRSPVAERSGLLNRVAELIDRDLEELAWLETLDTGKSLTESRDDMSQIEAVFRYYAALILTQAGSVNPVPADALSLTLQDPAGVVAMITPWNYPLLQASWKIAPALAAGCTFVIKPSELTPLTTLKIGELLGEAGLPAGVGNIVLGAGTETGRALIEHPSVEMISFTGGTATGRAIAAAGANGAKRVALELGGKNPNIVFADADLEAAVDHALNAVYFHAGQVCSAGSRLLLEDPIHDRVVEALLERASRIRVGFGWEETTEMGPLISAEHRERVEGYIRLAEQEGATLRLGGDRPQEQRLAAGYFLRPTLLTGLPSDGRVAREEIFGPVLTVERFGDAEEAIRLANSTSSGLAAGLWTGDAAKGLHAARRLRFGTVWLNDFHPYFPQASWGGFKESGVGRELGPAGLREYQEEKHLYLNLDVKPTGWFGRGERR